MTFPGAPVPAFTPASFSELKAWYRAENAVLSTTEVTSLPDALGGTAFARSVSAPGPQQGTTANGLKTLVYNGLEALVAADGGSSNAWKNGTWWGCAFWFKASAETAQGTFFSYWGSTLGLSANRIICGSSANTRVRQVIRSPADDGQRLAESNTGAGQFVLKTDVWQFLTFIFDGRRATEADRNRILLQGTPLPIAQALAYTDQSGTPGSGLTTLRTATAVPNQVAFGCSDVDQSTSAVAGAMKGAFGPDIFFFDPAMKQGKLMRLMNWRVPRG